MTFPFELSAVGSNLSSQFIKVTAFLVHNSHKVRTSDYHILMCIMVKTDHMDVNE